jgi:hypothetical protein
MLWIAAFRRAVFSRSRRKARHATRPLMPHATAKKAINHSRTKPISPISSAQQGSQ